MRFSPSKEYIRQFSLSSQHQQPAEADQSQHSRGPRVCQAEEAGADDPQDPGGEEQACGAEAAGQLLGQVAGLDGAGDIRSE